MTFSAFYPGPPRRPDEAIPCRKAIVSDDGRSIEVYAEGRRVVVNLPFSVWDVVAAARDHEVAEALDTERSLGEARR